MLTYYILEFNKETGSYTTMIQRGTNMVDQEPFENFGKEHAKKSGSYLYLLIDEYRELDRFYADVCMAIDQKRYIF